MQLQIFDVEHGACSLVTCDDQTRLMVDCGHNTATGWKPGTYLKQQGIEALELLAISNYDEDHVSGIGNLFDNIDVRWLWRNSSVSGAAICDLKSDDGMGAGIERLVYEIENVFVGTGIDPEPSFTGLERRAFFNRPTLFNDENNLSFVVYLKCHGVGVMFPGDLERAGWLELLRRQDFCATLRETSILVASHHGRASGCCREVFNWCHPFYIVISDKGYMYETQETIPFYRSVTKGGPFRGETRRVLTTRRDGRIGFHFSPEGWEPY